MNGTIAIEEERSTIDKIRKLYQEKVVDTGASKFIDKAYGVYMDMSAKTINAVIKVTGSASEIVLSFVKVDGEFGEKIVKGIADALPNIITAIAQINTKMMVGAKSHIEEKILKVEKEKDNTTYLDKENISEMKDKLKTTLEQLKEIKKEEAKQAAQNNENIIDAEFREIPSEGPSMGM